jgi:hypothetical protein
MEIRVLTPQNSREVVEFLLARRGWSISRIARITNTDAEFIRNVKAAKQSLEERDLEALAKAWGETPHMLLFRSIQPDNVDPDDRGLYELLRKEVERHEAFGRVLQRKPVKKRRARTRAA